MNSAPPPAPRDDPSDDGHEEEEGQEEEAEGEEEAEEQVVQNITIKRKEADKVTVSKLPDINGLPQWRAAVARNVQAASRRADYALVEWLLEAEGKDATFESLEKRDVAYASLDPKLCSALPSCVNRSDETSLIQHVHTKEAEALESREALRVGRCTG